MKKNILLIPVAARTGCLLSNAGRHIITWLETDACGDALTDEVIAYASKNWGHVSGVQITGNQEATLAIVRLARFTSQFRVGEDQKAMQAYTNTVFSSNTRASDFLTGNVISMPGATGISAAIMA